MGNRYYEEPLKEYTFEVFEEGGSGEVHVRPCRDFREFLNVNYDFGPGTRYDEIFLAMSDAFIAWTEHQMEKLEEKINERTKDLHNGWL